MIDAHLHLWRLDRGDYGWLDGKGGPLAPIRRDFTPDDMPGTVGVILVQAAPTEAETAFLLSLDSDRIKGVVGWADLTDPGAVARVDAPGLVGLRPMLQDIEQTDWLETAPHPSALADMAARGLVFDALVTARHLAVLDRFAARNPDLRIVIDHAAKPDLRAGTAPEDWAQGMAALARHTHVACKLSGLLTEMAPADAADRDRALAVLGPVVRRLIDLFGPDRLIWGSDWPVVTLAASHDDWAFLTGALLADLSDAERAAVMGGNARAVYGAAPQRGFPPVNACVHPPADIFRPKMTEGRAP